MAGDYNFNQSFPVYTYTGTYTTTATTTWTIQLLNNAQMWTTYPPMSSFVTVPTLSEAALRRMQEQERQRQEDAARWTQASKVANELLEECLSNEEKVSWKERECIEIRSQSGKHYRIRKGTIYNVDEMHGGLARAQLCAHPVGMLPAEDIVLGQYLALKYNEMSFLSVANRSPAWPGA